MPETSHLRCKSCGSTLHKANWQSFFVCTYCGKDYLLQPDGELRWIGEKGMTSAGPLLTQINEVYPPSPMLECPICGRKNPAEETYNCHECHRTGICLKHQEGPSRHCSDCEKRQSILPEINKAQEYLNALEQKPKNVRHFLETLKKYAGNEYKRSIQNEVIKGNLLSGILPIMTVFLAMFWIVYYKIDNLSCLLGVALLYLLLLFAVNKRSSSAYKAAREKEIRLVKDKLARLYADLPYLPPSASFQPLKPEVDGDGRPKRVDAGSQGIATPANQKSSSGKKHTPSKAWRTLLIIGGLLLGSLLLSRLNILPPNPITNWIWSRTPLTRLACPPFSNYRCSSAPPGGNSKSGYKWCQYDMNGYGGGKSWSLNGTSMVTGDVGEGWIPNHCIR